MAKRSGANDGKKEAAVRKAGTKTKAASSTVAASGKKSAAAPAKAAAPRAGARRKAVANARAAGQPPIIVALGASAGGLEACSELLSHLPSDTGMAFVFTQHLDPKRESMLSALLGRATPMQVLEVEDGMSIQPDHVYVIPPNQNLAIFHGSLQLQQREQGFHKPIDSFFRSLAEEAGSRCIAIVLSGTGADGSLGIEDVKSAGGITMAQEEGSAKYRDMPLNAIATGCVDFVLNPKRIAEELVEISKHPFVGGFGKPPKPDQTLDEKHLNVIFLLLRKHTGIDFAYYKQSTVNRRIQRRMVLHKIQKVAHYARYLHENPSEIKALCDDILINVTGFFRDPVSFDALKRIVFPEIVKHKTSTQGVRIWVPGCSSGEQVYSIAIALLEFLDKEPAFPIQIFGTDVSEKAVERARMGRYPQSIELDVSGERLKRFFSKVEDSYSIAKSIREMCVFARQNLISDPPFSRLDLIVCSNVLIYMGPVLQRRIIPIFHYALNAHGYLTLGNSETVGSFADLFSMVDSKSKIYSKKPGAKPLEVEFPIGVPSIMQEHENAVGPRVHAANVGFDVRKEADRLQLLRYAPAGVLVNENLDVMQYRGRTGAFLEPPPGPVSHNVLAMSREGLRADLREALQEARKKDVVVRRTKVRVRTNDHFREVNLEVSPIRAPGGKESYYLISFEETELRIITAPAPDAKPGVKNKLTAELGQIRIELDETRMHLQSIIEEKEAANEELKAANEEIQSANEELQSTNEELQTAKEELQSTNEELTTINEELQNRNTQLGDLYNDLNNLLSSMHIPIVMLDRQLRIRRFTPVAERLFNVIPTDIGRPLSDMKLNIEVSNLSQAIRDVIETLTVFRQDVRGQDGRSYAMQIRPYKTSDNKIDGAVITLVEKGSDGARA